MVKTETKWLGTKKTSEWFYTAGRTIKTGLITSSIVSAWTWSATLQSSTVTYKFGIGGSFWYAAGVTLILPLIEARTSISEIIHRAGIDKSPEKEFESEQVDDTKPIMKILVPVDGSIKSLKALNSANYLFRGSNRVIIYLLYVMEWPDENDENMDEELTMQMQEEGKLILRNVVVPKQLHDYKRIVKLGNPSQKIAEIADKLGVDLIVMGKKGLGRTDDELGHVSKQILEITTKPVTFI